MTVADDLATIKEDSALLADWAEEPTAISNVDADNCRARIVAAVEGVEAEIARLEADNAVLRELPSRQTVRRAEAAEAEVARFRAMEPFAKLYADSQAEVARLRSERDLADERATDYELQAARLRDGLRRTLRDHFGWDEESLAELDALLAEDGADR